MEIFIKHLEYFITEAVDEFDGDFACRGSRERPAGGVYRSSSPAVL
jgi:hypothetical protein